MTSKREKITFLLGIRGHFCVLYTDFYSSSSSSSIIVLIGMCSSWYPSIPLISILVSVLITLLITAVKAGARTHLYVVRNYTIDSIWLLGVIIYLHE